MLDDLEFLSLYETYVESVIRPTERNVRRVFQEWRTENYWQAYGPEQPGVADPRPTQRVRTRIKRPEAVRDKFQKLNAEFPDGPNKESLPLMRDILGARAVVYFPSHLAMVDEEIRSGRHFDVSNDYEPRCYIPAETLERIGLGERQFKMKGSSRLDTPACTISFDSRTTRGLTKILGLNSKHAQC